MKAIWIQIKSPYGNQYDYRFTVNILRLSFAEEISQPMLSVKNSTYIHTYIIGHYNPLVSIITQFLTLLILCAFIFIHKWWHLQFKADSVREIFEKLFIVLLIIHIFSRNLLRGSRSRNIFSYFFQLEVPDPGFKPIIHYTLIIMPQELQ